MPYSDNKKIILLGNIASMVLTFRKQLILDLVASGCEVYCLAQRYTNKEKKIIQQWGGVAIDSPLDAKGLNPFSDLKALVQLVKIFKKIQPDVVFSYFVKPIIFGSIAAKLAKVPRIIGMIEGLGNAFVEYSNARLSLKSQVVKYTQILLYKTALPLLHHLILLNKDDKRDLVDCYNIKVSNIDIINGIGLDLDEFSYTPANIDNISFIFIGRFLKEKGIFDYLQAAKAIKARYPNVVFYILGEFDEQNPFALKSADLDEYLQQDLVMYPGYIDNVYDWIVKSSVFVLPSYREGLPRSTQEAMAVGRPIITTDSVGCKETVKEGVNGFLVPICSVDSLTEKMRYFINNPNKIHTMGEQSRLMAEERFNVKKINEKLISIVLGDTVSV